MAHDVAEALAEQGLQPDCGAALALSSALEPPDLFEFTGLDCTTVGRRKAAGAMLPHDVAVKALPRCRAGWWRCAGAAWFEPGGLAHWLAAATTLFDSAAVMQRQVVSACMGTP